MYRGMGRGSGKGTGRVRIRCSGRDRDWGSVRGRDRCRLGKGLG